MEVQLSGSSMEELREKVRTHYGPEARIISAEAVTVGGIKGYLAKRHYEVTVSVPGPKQRSTTGRRSRAGIAALLEDADQAEFNGHPAPLQKRSTPTVSTMSGGFDGLVQDLARSTGTIAKNSRERVAAGARSRRAYRVPQPGRHPGDLTVVVGFQGQALKVCTDMAQAAAAAGAQSDDAGTRGVYTGGGAAVQGYLSLGNRAGAVAARAAGVEGGYPVFVAWGIESASERDDHFASLPALAPDQVWVTVDARMKEADTAAWVKAVREAVVISGVAVEHSRSTSTPETVDRLNLPVGWVDGRPNAAPGASQ